MEAGFKPTKRFGQQCNIYQATKFYVFLEERVFKDGHSTSSERKMSQSRPDWLLAYVAQQQYKYIYIFNIQQINKNKCLSTTQTKELLKSCVPVSENNQFVIFEEE